tara:strand:- start:4735 stop:4965 length:231 start_codon:yes stop_codon:yes gene_type:complete
MTFLQEALKSYRAGDPHQEKAFAFLEGRISKTDQQIFKSIFDQTIFEPPEEETKEDYQYVRDDHWLMGDCEDEDLL